MGETGPRASGHRGAGLSLARFRYMRSNYINDSWLWQSGYCNYYLILLTWKTFCLGFVSCLVFNFHVFCPDVMLTDAALSCRDASEYYLVTCYHHTMGRQGMGPSLSLAVCRSWSPCPAAMLQNIALSWLDASTCYLVTYCIVAVPVFRVHYRVSRSPPPNLRPPPPPGPRSVLLLQASCLQQDLTDGYCPHQGQGHPDRSWHDIVSNRTNASAEHLTALRALVQAVSVCSVPAL